jgi:hypothetical protein
VSCRRPGANRVWCIIQHGGGRCSEQAGTRDTECRPVHKVNAICYIEVMSPLGRRERSTPRAPSQHFTCRGLNPAAKCRVYPPMPPLSHPYRRFPAPDPPPTACIPLASAFQRPAPGLCVVFRVSCFCRPTAIGTFQRHSSQHPTPSALALMPPLSVLCPLLLTQSPLAASGCVQRTGCGACGLGYPQTPGLVGSPRAHSSCLAPVGFAGF